MSPNLFMLQQIPHLGIKCKYWQNKRFKDILLKLKWHLPSGHSGEKIWKCSVIGSTHLGGSLIQ